MCEQLVPAKGDWDVVRCIFCLTGSEQQVAARINGGGLATAIFPMRVRRIRVRGAWREEESPLLPGYVFVYSDAAFPFLSLLKMPDVIRILGYAEDAHSELWGADRQFAELLWARRGKFGTLKAIRIGERVEIVDGLLKQFSGRVVAMDRRKQMAKLELDIVGSIRHVWMSFDYIKEGQGG